MRYQNDRSSKNSKIFGKTFSADNSDSHVVGARLLVPNSHKLSDFCCFAPNPVRPLSRFAPIPVRPGSFRPDLLINPKN